MFNSGISDSYFKTGKKSLIVRPNDVRFFYYWLKYKNDNDPFVQQRVEKQYAHFKLKAQTNCNKQLLSPNNPHVQKTFDNSIF